MGFYKDTEEQIFHMWGVNQKGWEQEQIVIAWGNRNVTWKYLRFNMLICHFLFISYYNGNICFNICLVQLKLLKKRSGGENCMSEKENKNTEPVFQITSVATIKYVNQLAMAHCDLAMPKHCLQGTVNRVMCRNLLIKKKKILIYKKMFWSY